MRIQHNIPAMSAYRNYNNNTKSLSGNLEKLSSGYKINRAGDDAAGLAISEKMRAQITGLSAAQKNVKDGISLVKTAEGATQEIHDMLNRMAYLATQSANGTYDNDVDRANLQKEVEALKSEINRIADSANFNGINLLDGSMDAGKASDALKTEGAQKGTQVIISTASSLPQAAGTCTVLHKDKVDEAKTSFSVSLENLSYTNTSSVAAATNDAAVTLNVGGTAIAIAAGNIAGSKDGAGLANLFKTAAPTVSIKGVEYDVTAKGDKLVFTMSDKGLADSTSKASVTSFSGEFAVSITTAGYTQGNGLLNGSVNTGTQLITQGSYPASKVLANTQFTTAYTSANIVDGAGFKAGDTTYVFALSKDTLNTNFGGGVEVIDMTHLAEKQSNGTYELKENFGAMDYASEAMNIISNIQSNKMFSFGVQETTAGFILTFQEKDNYKGDADLKSLDGIAAQFERYDKVYVDETVEGGSGGKALQLQIGDTSEKYNQLKVSIGDMHTSALKIGDLDIGTQEGAADAIAAIKNAINYVSSVRGDLGATQNRLEHTGNNLSVMAENIQDAESTIRDTDVAEEMMSYVKNNILVQSAQAMLAQANQLPQGVLQLLG